MQTPGQSDAPSPDEPLPPAVRESLLTQALNMYRQGWFPMLDPDKDIVQWVQPYERGLIPLDDAFTVSRSLRARLRSNRFIIRTDTCFRDVIQACALPARGRETTWLCPEIAQLFELFHDAGIAHSIEAFLPTPQGEVLVGGLYGLRLGGIFCGESMFSRPDLGGTDASKVCLVHLVHHLRARGFSLLDSQLTNEHLAQFGCHAIPRDQYMQRLRRLSKLKLDWTPFNPELCTAAYA